MTNGQTTVYKTFHRKQRSSNMTKGQTTVYKTFHRKQRSSNMAKGQTTVYKTFHRKQRSSNMTKCQTTVYKPFHRKLRIEQKEPTKTRGELKCSPRRVSSSCSICGTCRAMLSYVIFCSIIYLNM